MESWIIWEAWIAFFPSFKARSWQVNRNYNVQSRWEDSRAISQQVEWRLLFEERLKKRCKVWVFGFVGTVRGRREKSDSGKERDRKRKRREKESRYTGNIYLVAWQHRNEWRALVNRISKGYPEPATKESGPHPGCSRCRGTTSRNETVRNTMPRTWDSIAISSGYKLEHSFALALWCL